MTKMALRRAWFQAHKWIGITLAILIIPLSLTGSALVWDDGVDALIHPARHAQMGPARLPPGTYVAKALTLLKPGEAVRELKLPGRDGGAVEVRATGTAQAKRRPGRTSLYLDPRDAHLIARSSDGGAMRVFHMIHGSLMVPGIGRQIVGWIGVAMLISCISGIWLWWPTVGSWLRGLRWRRHRNFDTNLHHMLGFWIALPLAALSLTGAWISFPAFFGQFDAHHPQRRGPDRRAMFFAAPLASPQLGLSDALSRASTIAPGPVRDIGWPTDIQPKWQIETAGGRAEVDDASGEAVAGRDRRRERPQSLSGVMRQLHSGHGLPFAWQLVIFISGLIPAILAVTGIIMWQRARKWRGDLKRRQRRVAD